MDLVKTPAEWFNTEKYKILESRNGSL